MLFSYNNFLMNILLYLKTELQVIAPSMINIFVKKTIAWKK